MHPKASTGDNHFVLDFRRDIQEGKESVEEFEAFKLRENNQRG
jgi:hypothetical protein